MVILGVWLNRACFAGYSGGEKLKIVFPQAAADDLLREGHGPGNDFWGWLNLLFRYDKDEFSCINAAAAKAQKSSEVLVTIGTGGSYLDVRALLETVQSVNHNALRKGRRKFILRAMQLDKKCFVAKKGYNAV